MKFLIKYLKSILVVPVWIIRAVFVISLVGLVLVFLFILLIFAFFGLINFEIIRDFDKLRDLCRIT
jgi:hypothetical protein